MSVLFAATYPERVVGLVLWGSFARLDAEGETTVGDQLDAGLLDLVGHRRIAGPL